jgi:hypothetical protein
MEPELLTAPAVLGADLDALTASNEEEGFDPSFLLFR